MRQNGEWQWAESKRDSLKLIRKAKVVSAYVPMLDSYMPVTKRYIIEAVSQNEIDYDNYSVFYNETTGEVRIG